MSIAILSVVLLAFVLFVTVRQMKNTHLFTRPPRSAWSKATFLAGIALLAVPGLITLADTAFSSPGVDPLDGKEIMTPGGRPVNTLDAGAFLIRAFLTVKGAEDFPIDYVQAVVPVRGEKHFTLLDGRELSIFVTSQFEEPHGERVNFAYRIEGLGTHDFASGPIDNSDRRELEAGHRLYQKSDDLRYRSARPLGSLFSSTVHPGDIRFWLTPLEDTGSVDTMPAEEWWSEHAHQAGALFNGPGSGWQSSGRGSGLDFGPVTGSGLGLMILGALCLVFTSAHGLRTFCIIAICAVAYAGMVDGAVVKIETARLDAEKPEEIAGAAIETAGTVLHPVTAARELLALAESEKSVALRSLAVNCLERSQVLDALRELSDGEGSLRELATNENPELARSARLILQRLTEPDQPESVHTETGE